MIKLHAKELLARTKTAIKVVASKNSMPILGCAMLETKGNNLVITTSDGEQWLSQKCPMIECDQEARFCVNATDFMDAIANISDVPITITIEDGTHTITCDYGSGRFSMPYEDVDEFPTAKTPTDGKFDCRWKESVEGNRAYRPCNRQRRPKTYTEWRSL